MATANQSNDNIPGIHLPLYFTTGCSNLENNDDDSNDVELRVALVQSWQAMADEPIASDCTQHLPRALPVVNSDDDIFDDDSMSGLRYVLYLGNALTETFEVAERG